MISSVSENRQKADTPHTLNFENSLQSQNFFGPLRTAYRNTVDAAAQQVAKSPPLANIMLEKPPQTIEASFSTGKFSDQNSGIIDENGFRVDKKINFENLEGSWNEINPAPKPAFNEPTKTTAKFLGVTLAGAMLLAGIYGIIAGVQNAGDDDLYDKYKKSVEDKGETPMSKEDYLKSVGRR
jgi:hypothetical protein